jgi:hypothetical protein
MMRKFKPPVGVQLNSQHPLSVGLFAWWLFNEGAGTRLGDISGNSRHGVLTNFSLSGNTSNWIGSNKGGGLHFDGTNDYVNMPALVWPHNSKVSVSFWTNTPGGSNGSAFCLANPISSSTNIFQAHCPYSDNTLYWDYGTNVNGRISTSFASYLNKWTHVVLVNNGVDFKAIYINGVLITSSTTVATPPTAVTGFQIGLWTSVNTHHKGTIDDFRIYNRVLSQLEINQLFADPYANLLFTKNY